MGKKDAAPRVATGSLRGSQSESVEGQLLALKKINAGLEDFSAAAAHGLQAPMRHLSLYSELLGAHVAQGLDPKGRHYLGQIDQAASDMRDLIGTHLRFARALPGGTSLQPVELVTVVERALQHQAAALMKAGAQTHVALDGVRVMADQSLLTQVFANLVDNALKFHPPGGTLEIAVYADQRDDRAIVSFVDNGSGIDPNHAESIFALERHQRRAGAKAAEAGIGLPLCRRIMLYHHGAIELDQAHSDGARFLLTLPVAGK